MLFFKASTRKSAPHWRSPATFLEIDDTGVTVKFQSQTFKAARYCVGMEVEEQDEGEVEWNPASGRSDTWDGAPSAELGGTQKNVRFPL